MTSNVKEYLEDGAIGVNICDDNAKISPENANSLDLGAHGYVRIILYTHIY